MVVAQINDNYKMDTEFYVPPKLEIPGTNFNQNSGAFNTIDFNNQANRPLLDHVNFSSKILRI